MASNRKSNHKKIFISWSGDNSKTIAREVKRALEEMIFIGTGLECFVSDVNISAGDDWWNKIKSELKKCELGIVCITKENIKAPWVFFESGAMIARDLKLIPLLFNCNIKALSNTPIASKNMVDFYNQEKFINMILSINKDLQLIQIDDNSLKIVAEDGYKKLAAQLTPTLKKLKAMRIFNEKYIYPQGVGTVNLNTVYISAAMSSISSKEYEELRDFLLDLRPKLYNLGFSSVICPIFDHPDYNNFDGNTKAIKENFIQMKKVESMIVIYPKALPSSVLVEIGYALALCKKTIIFFGEKHR